MASIHKTTSLYKLTPIKDFYLDLWVPREILPRSDDLYVQVSSKYHLRPDRLAYDLYETSNLFWVFAMRNKDILIDPIEDFKSGTRIFIPSKAAMSEAFL